MALQKREIITISTGAAIVVVSLLFVWVRNQAMASEMDSDSLEGTIKQIETFHSAKASVESLQAELRVKMPTLEPRDQEKTILDDLGQKAKDKGLAYTSLKPVNSSTKKRSMTGPFQVRMEVSGKVESLLDFVDSLERSSLPYQVLELRVDSATLAPRNPDNEILWDEEEGPPPPGNGKIRAVMKIQGYIFPYVKNA